MDKMIQLELSLEEYKALIVYFDNTEINISKMIKNEGLKTTKAFEDALTKIYKHECND
jgi:hypothetical protein